MALVISPLILNSFSSYHDRTGEFLNGGFDAWLLDDFKYEGVDANSMSCCFWPRGLCFQ